MKTPYPPDEADCQESLQRNGILDMQPEQLFDDIAFLAASICGTPISVMTLVEADRQWIKATIGLAECETPHDITFCNHTIMGTDLMLIPNATADARFAGSPLVMEFPFIRFYAGMPLIAHDGQALGALSVLDTVPRELTDEQQDALRRLARQSVELLEARQQRIALRQSAEERALVGESLAVFAAIVGSSHDAIISKSLQGEVTSWNEGAQNLFGYTATEVLGRPITIIIPPDRLDEEPMILAKLAAGEKVEHFETIRMHKDGHLLDVSESLSPIKDSAGKIVGISKIARDITERKVAEKAIRDSESRFSGIVNAAMDAIISVNDSQQIVLFNPAAEKMFGYVSEDVIGQRLETLIPQRFRAGHPAHIRNFGLTRLTNRKMGAIGDPRGLRAEGTEFPIEASISQVQVDGQGLHTVILRDITERKLAESQLRERAEFQHALLENFPNGSVKVFDRELRYVLAAGRGLEDVGIRPNQLIGKTLDQVFSPELTSLMSAHYRKVLEGKSIEFDLSFGGNFYSINAVPLKDPDGQVANILAVTQDISCARRPKRH